MTKFIQGFLAASQPFKKTLTYGFITGFLISMLSACGVAGNESGSENQHQPLTASAGSTKTIEVGDTVTLDGTGSNDPDGIVELAYKWAFISVPAGSISKLSNIATATPSFTADVAGDYIIEVAVRAGPERVTDRVTISAAVHVEPNELPVAMAGAVQIVTVGESITLDGSASSDPESETLSYHWSFDSIPTGSDTELNNANTETADFTTDIAGVYRVKLVVSDGTNTATAYVNHGTFMETVYKESSGYVITIPDADIVNGVASTISVTNGPKSLAYVAVYIDVVHAYNEDLFIRLEGPDGSVTPIVLSNHRGHDSNNYSNTIFVDSAIQSITEATATGPFTGTFRPEEALSAFNFSDSNGDWRLHLNDAHIGNEGNLIKWSLLLSSDSISNLPPVYNIIANKTVLLNETVLLDGRSSWDPEGEVLTYQWSVISKPVGSLPVINNARLASASFDADATGDYVIALRVSDGFTEVGDVFEVHVVSGTTYGNNASVSIPDFLASASPATKAVSTINVSNGTASISSIIINLNIDHSYTEDLYIELASPNGTFVLLSSNNGGGAINAYSGSTFDDSSSITIMAAVPPYTGSFAPEEVLSAFNGLNSNGTWTLNVYDDYNDDVGTLIDWSIVIQ